MNAISTLTAGLLIIGLYPIAVSADWNMSYEEIIASVDAHVTACSDLYPEIKQKSQLALEKVLTDKQLQDIPCIRKTDIYKNTYKQEFGWLMSLTLEERKDACHHAL